MREMSMMVGALFTLVCFEHDLLGLLPGVWMLLYGVGVVAAAEEQPQRRRAAKAWPVSDPLLWTPQRGQGVVPA